MTSNAHARRARTTGRPADDRPDGLRVAVVDDVAARRQQICAGLVGDVRVGVVHAMTLADAELRLGPLGADLVVVGAADARALVRAVAASRACDADAHITMLGCDGLDVLAGMLAGADRLAPAGLEPRTAFGWRETLLPAGGQIAMASGAANGERYAVGLSGLGRPGRADARVRLVLVFGADGASGTLARLELAARHHRGVSVVAQSMGHQGLLPALADGSPLVTGRLNVVSPGDRLILSGEVIRARRHSFEDPTASDVALVDAALDAVGPGVVALCLGDHELSPLARWRLRNDGSALLRVAVDQLEWGLDRLVRTAQRSSRRVQRTLEATG